MVVKRLKISGNYYNVYYAGRKSKKKYYIKKDGKEIYFGAKGYSISPNTKKGDRYCARSLGIKTKSPFSPNALSRKMWECIGKSSRR